MASFWQMLAAAPFVAVLAGCSGIDHTTLDGVNTPPDNSTLSETAGAMHTGIAVAFRPRVWTHDVWGTHEQTSGIDVQSSDTSVLRVAHVTNDTRVVVWGAAPGQATLTVTLNGEAALRVPVVVQDPPQPQ
jgi:hypothetical protein